MLLNKYDAPVATILWGDCVYRLLLRAGLGLCRYLHMLVALAFTLTLALVAFSHSNLLDLFLLCHSFFQHRCHLRQYGVRCLSVCAGTPTARSPIQHRLQQLSTRRQHLCYLEKVYARPIPRPEQASAATKAWRSVQPHPTPQTVA